MSENRQGWRDQAKGPGPWGEVQTLKDSLHPQSQSQCGKSPSRCRGLGEAGGIGHEREQSQCWEDPKVEKGGGAPREMLWLLPFSKLPAVIIDPAGQTHADVDTEAWDPGSARISPCHTDQSRRARNETQPWEKPRFISTG